MTSSMLPPSAETSAAAAQKPLIIINKISIKSFNSKNIDALKFIILNDTVHLFPYDRAVLFDMRDDKMKLIGVSGLAKVQTQGALQAQWKELVHGIREPTKFQQLTEESFDAKAQATWKKYQERTTPSLYWLPILYEGQPLLGLMLEKWPSNEKPLPSQETMDMINNLLLPGFAVAWVNKARPSYFKHIPLEKPQWILFGIALILSLFIIRVPLRVIAPCEVVPKNPFLIAAPLEGIIENVIVTPGQVVKQGQPLVEYDKRVPLQQLKVAQKEVEIMQAESNRSMTLGMNDPKALSELAVINLKLDKAKVNLDLAEYHATLLTIKAPVNGIVMLDNPEEWRGKPVRVGEKILTISDPEETKVRIWIPESDNIILDESKPIKVYLNISPERGYDAKLIYIANESTVSEKHLPSFIADANWVEEPDNIKLGLKGTALLYGDRVSLFYYLARKPWGAIRRLTGF